MNAATQEKHTPGPWEFVPNAHAGDIIANGRRVASIAAPSMSGARPEEDANARLIAAAPDLLAAAQALKLAAQNHPDELLLDENSPLRDALRDAIKKAAQA